ncbi:MAG: hypothetical protein ABEK17_02415 [Candidatus Aenigmatarchaeota archaeon]
MGRTQINARIPDEYYDKLNVIKEEIDGTFTEALIQVLTDYFESATDKADYKELENRCTELESKNQIQQDYIETLKDQLSKSDDNFQRELEKTSNYYHDLTEIHKNYMIQTQTLISKMDSREEKIIELEGKEKEGFGDKIKRLVGR